MKAETKIVSIGYGGCIVVNHLMKKGLETSFAVCDEVFNQDLAASMLSDGTREVVMVCCLGGDEGPKHLRILVQEAKKLDIKTTAVVTSPFAFEGKARLRKAAAAIELLSNEVDELKVVDYDVLKDTHPEMTVVNSFSIADKEVEKVVLELVRG